MGVTHVPCERLRDATIVTYVLTRAGADRRFVTPSILQRGTGLFSANCTVFSTVVRHFTQRFRMATNASRPLGTLGKFRARTTAIPPADSIAFERILPDELSHFRSPFQLKEERH